MGNTNINPDQSNTKRGGIIAIANADLTGMRSRLGVLVNDAGVLEVKLPAAVTDLALVLIDDDGLAGAEIPLSPIVPDENVRVVAKGAGNPGDVLVLADPGTAADKGKVRVLPAGAGVYFSPGIAEEAFVDGQLVLMRPAPQIVRVKSADTLTALNFTAGGATGPEVDALRDALLAILQAQGLVVTA